MSEKKNRFEQDLDRLIVKGDLLYMAILHETNAREFDSRIFAIRGEDEGKEFLKRLPNFREDYQAWYLESCALVKQIFPDKLNDFVSYFEYPRVRKEITYQNYTIRDYLKGLRVTRGYDNEVIADGTSAVPEFEQQLNIVKAARSTLESTLINLTSILQAELFDAEIDSARALAKSGFLRPAGAVCGVMIERHLKKVCENHRISFRKKKLVISDFLKALKEKDVISVEQWRFLQFLADLRNLCLHDKGKEPTNNEVEDLISGTEKILKTVF